MQSIRSFIIRETSRAFIKANNRKSLSIDEQREMMESLTKFVKIPQNINIEKFDIDGVKIEKITHVDADNENIIMHLHGGGYTTCSINTHRLLASAISKASKSQVVLPSYRLAPEYPFPAALDDSLKVYRGLLSQGIKPSNIIISGDSAGGGLAVATVMFLRDNGEQLPIGVICISPWVDLMCTGNSHLTNVKADPTVNIKNLKESALLYAGGEDIQNPLLSPIYGDYQSFPPMLIQVGSEEILLDDSITLAEKARTANVEVNLKVWKGMWHVWHIIGDIIPESRMAIEEIGAFACGLLKN